MNFNYTLKYRTYDQLFEDVRVDFKNFSLEGKIDPQSLIKVALRVNYDLGLRINQPKEKVLSIEKGRCKLPDDFIVMNYALLCGTYTSTVIPPQGTHIEEVAPGSFAPCYKDPIEPTTCTDPEVDPCCPTSMVNTTTPVCLTQCGSSIQLVQVINRETRTFKALYPIKFKNSREVHCDCPNLNWLCFDEAYIREGFIWIGGRRQHTNSGQLIHQTAECANLFINYEGALLDDNGNIMVPDHPILNEYYEYALKDRILEALAMDGENVNNQINIVKPALRAARNNALTIVNMPNFSEMQHLWAMNRKAMYSRFYDMFKSHGNWGGSLKVGNQV